MGSIANPLKDWSVNPSPGATSGPQVMKELYSCQSCVLQNNPPLYLVGKAGPLGSSSGSIAFATFAGCAD